MASPLDPLDRVMAERVETQGEVPVNAGDVLRWSEAHRETAARHWPDRTADWVAPPAMVTSFVRPLEWRPDRAGPPGHRGSSLHERLKAELGFPLGIAAGYELELRALLRDGDRVGAVERIASVGEPETTRLGPGRRWVIENEIRRVHPGVPVGTGELVAVERFHMLGYHPSAPPASDAPSAIAARPALRGSPGQASPDHVSHRGGAGVSGSPGQASPDDVSHRGAEGGPGGAPLGRRHLEEVEVTAVVIAMGASANRVWVAAHLDRDAAQAAGVRDQFVDTSTQLGLLSGVAVRAAGPDARPGRLALRMRRPVCPGDRLVMEARAGDPMSDAHGVRWVDVDVTASVDDALHSTLTARVAVAGPADRPDPWSLDADRWRP